MNKDDEGQLTADLIYAVAEGKNIEAAATWNRLSPPSRHPEKET